MPKEVEWDLSGLESLRKRMTEFQENVQERQLSFAARKAAQVIARQAARNALKLDDPRTSEEIAANIWDGGGKYPGVRKQSKRRSGKGNIVYRIGVAGGARSYSNTRENRRKGRVGQTYSTLGSSDNPGGDTFYWRFLELGTEKIAARPFLRPAAQQASGETVATFTEELGKAIDRAARKAARAK